MIRAIFFDFDGVLVDSEPLHLACWAEVLATHNMSFSPDFYYENFVGISNQEMLQILCRQYGRDYDTDFFERVYADKRVLYEERTRDQLQFPPELIFFVNNSLHLYRFGVVSSSSRSEVEPHLIGQGIRPAITALVCGRDVPNLKPAPDPYLRALELVNNGNREGIVASECLVIEDSGPGVESARRAGMKVVQVPGPAAVFGLLQAELAG